MRLSVGTNGVKAIGRKDGVRVSDALTWIAGFDTDTRGGPHAVSTGPTFNLWSGGKAVSNASPEQSIVTVAVA